MADFVKSRRTVACPDCGQQAHIIYTNETRQLGNWEAHNDRDGKRCGRSRKKALRSKYRGL